MVSQSFIGHNIKYIASFEARDYPIYATMYHPEYQVRTLMEEQEHLVKKEVDRNVIELRTEIEYMISFRHSQMASRNNNKVKERDFMQRYGIERVPVNHGFLNDYRYNGKE